MSIDYEAIPSFGIHMSTSGEVDKFLNLHNIEIDRTDGLCNNSIGCTCLDLYSGEGYIIGFWYELGDPVEIYQKMWNEIFPNSEIRPKLSIDVQIY